MFADTAIPLQPARHVSVPDAAAFLGVSPRHVWRLIKAGTLAHYRLGRRTVIGLPDLRALLHKAKHDGRGSV